ncbi:MAG TPA: alpha/beta fold hydrolase [Polyangiales bacterium]|nr:alpha/beta fold hydrolase [Polyangiales bacterium]
MEVGGIGTPVFIFPGIGGELSDFASLAKRLGRERAIYGVRLAGMQGECEPVREMQKLASIHAADLCLIQPRGPYILLGYSFGGSLALEVARELQSLGRRVGLLILADAPAPGYPELPPAHVRALAHLTRLLQLDTRARLDYFKSKVARRVHRVRRLLGMSEPVVAAQSPVHDEPPIDRRVLNALDEAYLNYRPTPLAVDALVLSCDVPPDLPGFKFDDPLLGWGPVLLGHIIQCQTPGTHFDLFSPSNLEVLAQHVRAGIAHAERAKYTHVYAQP